MIKKLLLTMIVGSFLQCAVAGMPEALAAYNAKNYELALSELMPLVKRGHADAQFTLGTMQLDGHGVVQDEIQAAGWFRKAADQGHADAQNTLGHLYTIGRGVEEDHAQAVAWYRKAAEQRHARAQLGLGTLYFVNSADKGKTKDVIVAYALVELSIKTGLSPTSLSFAGQAKATIAQTLKPGDIAAADVLTKELQKDGNFQKALDDFLANPKS